MKKRVLRGICLAVAILGGLELLGNLAAWGIAKCLMVSAARGEIGTVGIIGGADGPTTVFVASAGVVNWLLPLALVAMGIAGYICLKKCNK